MAITSQAALEIILQARDEASGVLQKAGGSVGSLGKIAAGAAAGGIALAGTAIAGTAAAAFNFSQTTDEAMRNFQAQTGASEEAMADFRTQAMDVFEAGWGENVEDIAGSMASVNQVLGETGDALEDSTRRALVLRDTFGIEVQEGVSIAGAAIKSDLVENSEEAFDLMTTGFQQGLNQAGDFGDTIREYSSDFQRLGFDADEMLGVLNAGLEKGAWNTDVVADGVREFGIRFGAAEESAVKALDAIGLNSEELYEQYESGEITVADAMETITGALGETDSATLRAQAGAALFGSKWEDIGGDVFMAAGQARDAIQDMEGATDEAGETLSEGLGPALKELKRTALVALAPLGDEMGAMVEKAIPYIEKLATWLSVNVPVAIDWLSAKWAEVWPQVQAALVTAWGILQPILQRVSGWFSGEGPEAVGKLQAIWNSVWPQIQAVAQAVIGAVMPFIQEQFAFVVDWVKTNWPLIQATVQTVMGAIQAVITAVLSVVRAIWQTHGAAIMANVRSVWTIIKTIISTAIKVVLGIIKAVMQIITGDWEGAWETIKGVVRTVWDAIKSIINEVGEIIKRNIASLVDAIKQKFTNIDWRGIGRAIIDGIAGGISAAAGRIADAARQAAQNALNAAKSFLGIGSPSKAFLEVGANVSESFAEGINAVMPDVTGAMRGLTAGIPAGGRAPQLQFAGAGMSQTIQVNFGRDSVRSDEDIEEIMRRFEQILNRRGIRSWGV